MNNFTEIAMLAICLFASAQALQCKKGNKSPYADTQVDVTCPYACIITDYHLSYSIGGPQTSYNQSSGGCADKAMCADPDQKCVKLHKIKFIPMGDRKFPITFTDCRSHCCFTDMCNEPGPQDGIPKNVELGLDESDNWASKFGKPLVRPTKGPKDIY